MDHRSETEDVEIVDINLEDIVKILGSINPNKFNEKENRDGVELYFIAKDKENKEKSKYTSYSPSISENIQKDMIQIVSNRIEEIIKLIEIKGYLQDHYNPSGQVQGIIEICSKKFIKDIEDIISCLNQENQAIKMLDINDIHTYCFDFKHKDKRIIAFRRFTKMKRLREGFLGTLNAGTFKKIGKDILGVDNDVDLILYGEKVLILNHISLERIFDLDEQFKNEAKETVNMIRSQNVILNFEDFENDVLNNIPAVKRLTKIGANGTLPLFFNNFKEVVKVSNTFDLGITFNDDSSKIVYEDKSQITEITLLMNDSYYKTLIGGQCGTDKLK